MRAGPRFGLASAERCLVGLLLGALDHSEVRTTVCVHWCRAERKRGEAFVRRDVDGFAAVRKSRRGGGIASSDVVIARGGPPAGMMTSRVAAVFARTSKPRRNAYSIRARKRRHAHGCLRICLPLWDGPAATRVCGLPSGHVVGESRGRRRLRARLDERPSACEGEEGCECVGDVQHDG
jgi:hypothetical protein